MVRFASDFKLFVVLSIVKKKMKTTVSLSVVFNHCVYVYAFIVFVRRERINTPTVVGLFHEAAR